MGKPGRRTKRTPENRRRILDGLRLGMTYKLAAQYGSLAERTLYDWLAADAQFSQDCKDAEASNAAQALAHIVKAARDGNWTAGAWLLERRHRYTKTEKIEHSGEVRTVRVDLTGADVEELDRLAEAVLAEPEPQRVH